MANDTAQRLSDNDLELTLSSYTTGDKLTFHQQRVRKMLEELRDTRADYNAITARLVESVTLVRRYFWNESRSEGRRTDEAAMAFLDANGGRELGDPILGIAVNQTSPQGIDR